MRSALNLKEQEPSMIETSEKEIEQHLTKWQDVLRLRDWDIMVRIVKTKWRKSGDIKIDLDDKKAVLLINHNSKCEKREELEEFLSLVYGKKDTAKREFAQTQFMTLLESTTEDLTKGYLEAAKSQNALSFGRLSKSIEEELGKD
jgi:hypothetical protein